jgi:glycosyltransferase involved in cell wall biosynthesis
MVGPGAVTAPRAGVENLRRMRALVVTNMWPSPAAPARGSFVRDQVDALRRLEGVAVDVFAFAADGDPRAYARAAREIRRAHRGAEYDVIHAHFGLSAYPALALRGAPHAVTLHGTDVRHPRSGRLTRLILGRMDLVAAVSAGLAREVAGAGGARDVAVLPCGADLTRFRPIDRAQARERLGLDPEEPCLLFPADPARAGKRHDRALAVAGGTRLLTLGEVDPADVPLWVNAANAVLVPSDAEGFGLAVVEALACDVPVLATPVGIHPVALDGIPGTLCAAFAAQAWRAAAEPHLRAPDPRVEGRARAELFSADRMARRVLAAWSGLSGAPLYSAAEAPGDGAVFT